MRSRDGLPDYETGAAVFLWKKCLYSERVYSGAAYDIVVFSIQIYCLHIRLHMQRPGG